MDSDSRKISFSKPFYYTCIYFRDYIFLCFFLFFFFVCFYYYHYFSGIRRGFLRMPFYNRVNGKLNGQENVSTRIFFFFFDTGVDQLT